MHTGYFNGGKAFQTLCTPNLRPFVIILLSSATCWLNRLTAGLTLKLRRLCTPGHQMLEADGLAN